MKFSIIIPVYNVEKYIDRCLSSLTAQSCQDFEVIVVDDETPDNSMAIAERYVQQYPNQYRVIHQKNKGQGGARNTGVAVAQGEYLLFIDSDDYVEPNMLQVINQRLEQSACDILLFNYQEVAEEGELLAKRSLYTENRITSIEKENKILVGPPAPWNKVFRREFYLDSAVCFSEKKLYEDAVTYILLAKAKSVQLCTEHLYNYVQRAGSTMRRKVSERNLEIIYVIDSIYDRLVKDGLYCTYQDAIDAALTMSVVSVINVVNNQKFNHPMQKALVDYVVQKFPDIQNNPYLFEEEKTQIAFLLKEQYLRYRLRKNVQRTKVALLKVPLVAKLNRIRKNRM